MKKAGAPQHLFRRLRAGSLMCTGITPLYPDTLGDEAARILLAMQLTLHGNPARVKEQ
jgi:hypothetical protein